MDNVTTITERNNIYLFGPVWNSKSSCDSFLPYVAFTSTGLKDVSQAADGKIPDVKHFSRLAVFKHLLKKLHCALGFT